MTRSDAVGSVPSIGRSQVHLTLCSLDRPTLCGRSGLFQERGGGAPTSSDAPRHWGDAERPTFRSLPCAAHAPSASVGTNTGVNRNDAG